MASTFLSAPGLLLLLILADFSNGVDAKMRQKREWVVPAQKLIENVDYTGKPYVARVRSDKDVTLDLDYYLNGPGATEAPFNLFIVDRRTGFIRITGILDRENIPVYTMSAAVKYKNGSIAEDNIEMTIKVIDQNDNPPVFDELSPGNVSEGSPPGTFVTQVRATDTDDPATLHAAISYSIIKQEPEDTGFMFNINSSSGQIHVWKPEIDRERYSSYVLTVKATDMNGHPGGLTGTGTVTVKVLDINDNMPTLEKDEYEGSVDENTANMEVLRMNVLDKDLERTDNWLADFEIVSGNEDDMFSIETDPKTNEGILILRKEVDFEQVPNMQLGVVVQNLAPFPVGSTGSGSSPGLGSDGTSGLGSLKQYPIKITVRNRPDDPQFVPKVKTASVPEGSTNIILPHVIANYPVIDGDSGTVAKNIWYAKDYDPEQWLTIDEKTAEVKLNKVPDRESKYVKDGIYYAKVIGVMKDFPYKTATGTLAIQVRDSNDHCPHITSTHQVLCSDVQAVTVTAVDEDSHPNAAPFEFTLLTQNPSDQWKLETFNDTAAILRLNSKLWPGSFKITMLIKDHQGLACSDNQVLNLDVCTCTEDTVCGNRISGRNSVSLGPSAIGTLLLGILLLLSVPLLLLSCGPVKGLGPDYVDLAHPIAPTLIDSHTEGIGDDKEVILLTPLVPKDKGPLPIRKPLHPGFLEKYYLQKTRYISEDNHENDIIKKYNSEFGSSPAGSFSSIKFVEMDDNLDFLNDLDLQFKTLAEVCTQGETGFEDYRSFEKGITKDVVKPNHKIYREGTETANAEQLKTRPSSSVGKISITAGTQELNTESLNSGSSAGKISMTAGIQELNTTNSNTSSSAGKIPKTTTAFPSLQVREDTIDSNQMCLIHQPVYCTTTPVLQSTRYVVEPQVQNIILVSGWPSVPNMQTMHVVNGAPRSDTMGERVLLGPSAQNSAFSEHMGTLRMKENILSVEREGTSGLVVQRATAKSNQGLVQMGNVPKSENIIFSRKVQLEDPSHIQEGSRGSTHAPQKQGGFTEEHVNLKDRLRTRLPEGSTAE